MTMLPGSLAVFPRLADWVTIERTGIVSVRTGKVEIGQGIITALAQIVADELDVIIGRVRIQSVSTDASPDEGYTAGSMSIERSGEALRQVCAELRFHLLQEAARRSGRDVELLSVQDGDIVDDHGALVASYWDLAAAIPAGCEATGHPGPKPAQARTVIGSS